MLVDRTRTLLLVAFLCACLPQAAGATDFSIFSVTPPQPETPNWAGFYLGNHATGADASAWMNLGTTSTFTSPGTPASAVNDTFGYNFQSGNFVFGLEGSLAAANFDGRFTSPYLPAAGAWSPNMNWLGTVTGRVGYSFGQWLPYVKGGFAAADVATPAGTIGGFTQGSTEHAGWTAGVGLEYQLTPKWSLGLEYLYTDLNSVGGPPTVNGPDLYSTALKSQSLLGRLNYRAGW